MRRKQERLAEFNRGIILNAAQALFEAKGVAQTTMDDIAGKADCSKSTIYVYFRSKDEIFDTIIYEYMVLLKSGMEAAIAKESDIDALYFSICRILTDFQCGHPLFFEGMLGELGVDEADFSRCPVLRDVYSVGEEMNAVMATLITKGMASGYFRSDLKPVPTLLSLWAGLCGIIGMADKKEKYLRDRLGITKEDYLDYGFRLLLKSLKAGE